MGGMPICMDGFDLFNEYHRSSYPLNIAYKAAVLTDKSKADIFLYALRYATIAEAKKTTKIDELIKIARSCGIDADKFLRFFDGEAKHEFSKDLNLTARLKIYNLPSHLLEYGEKRET